MNEEHKEESKSSSTILIVGIVLVIIGLTIGESVPEKTMGFFIISLLSVAGFILVLVGGIGMLGIFKNIAKEKIVESRVKNEVKEELNYQNQLISKNERIYNDAKQKFQFLSDEILLNEYNHGEEEDIVRLALEEELVTRKLIKHSPLHEKLYLLEKHFLKE